MIRGFRNASAPQPASGYKPWFIFTTVLKMYLHLKLIVYRVYKIGWATLAGGWSSTHEGARIRAQRYIFLNATHLATVASSQ